MIKYDADGWEHTYVSKDVDSFVVTERTRIAESEVNSQERQKFDKELSMCKTLADNGHDVEFLRGGGRARGETYDIRLDGIPADLKCITGTGASIPKYAKHAFREQGAKIVIFKLLSHDKNIYATLKEAQRKYGKEGKIYFYFADDTRLREIKK